MIILYDEATTKEFAYHSYQALFNGSILSAEEELRHKMVETIVNDVIIAARTLSPLKREELIQYFNLRMRGGH